MSTDPEIQALIDQYLGLRQRAKTLFLKGFLTSRSTKKEKEKVKIINDEYIACIHQATYVSDQIKERVPGWDPFKFVMRDPPPKDWPETRPVGFDG